MNDRKPGWQADRDTIHKDNTAKRARTLPPEAIRKAMGLRERRRALEERQEIKEANEWL